MVHQLFKIFTWMGSEWILMTLIALSIVTVAVILQRWFTITKLLKTSYRLWEEQAENWFQSGETPKDATAIEELQTQYPCLDSEVMNVIQRAGNKNSEEKEKVASAYLESRKLTLERNIGILGTIGSNAPFIGLLGTVLGIIRAFHDMSQKGLAGGMDNISSGIAEALVATAVGLMVAIPAVVFFNILNKRVALLVRRAQSVGTLMVADEDRK